MIDIINPELLTSKESVRLCNSKIVKLVTSLKNYLRLSLDNDFWYHNVQLVFVASSEKEDRISHLEDKGVLSDRTKL